MFLELDFEIESSAISDGAIRDLEKDTTIRQYIIEQRHAHDICRI